VCGDDQTWVFRDCPGARVPILTSMLTMRFMAVDEMVSVRLGKTVRLHVVEPVGYTGVGFR
jgi:hypothetical protein